MMTRRHDDDDVALSDQKLFRKKLRRDSFFRFPKVSAEVFFPEEKLVSQLMLLDNFDSSSPLSSDRLRSMFIRSLFCIGAVFRSSVSELVGRIEN